MRLIESGLEYELLWNERLVIERKDIDRGVFCREKTLFPDRGRYPEIKWQIKKARRRQNPRSDGPVS